MPDPTGSPPDGCRSPFVARLVASAKLTGLMDTMEAAGVTASSGTLASVQALRQEIDDRMRRIAADIPRTLSATPGALPPPSPEVQLLLDELQVLITQLDGLQGVMHLHRGAAPSTENPPCN